MINLDNTDFYTDGTDKLRKVLRIVDSTDNLRYLLTHFTDVTEKLKEVLTSADK